MDIPIRYVHFFYNIVYMKNILVNSIMTPDGTILRSRHRHDFIGHEDKNGEFYMVDGGTDYLKRSTNVIPYIELSVYDTDDFDLIRNSLDRYDTRSDKFIKVSDMTNEWLVNLIDYLRYQIGQEDSDLPLWVYIKEVRHRNIETLIN